MMFAFACGSTYLIKKGREMMNNIEKKDFSLLPLLHHYCSGMKAVYTQDQVDSLFIIRQSLGGAGYSGWSGIPMIIDGQTLKVTVEGDNTVMLS